MSTPEKVKKNKALLQVRKAYIEGRIDQVILTLKNEKTSASQFENYVNEVRNLEAELECINFNLDYEKNMRERR